MQTLTKETRQVQTQANKRLGLKSNGLALLRFGELFKIHKVLGKSSRLVFMGEAFSRRVALQVNLFIDRLFMIAWIRPPLRLAMKVLTTKYVNHGTTEPRNTPNTRKKSSFFRVFGVFCGQIPAGLGGQILGNSAGEDTFLFP